MEKAFRTAVVQRAIQDLCREGQFLPPASVNSGITKRTDWNLEENSLEYHLDLMLVLQFFFEEMFIPRYQ